MKVDEIIEIFEKEFHSIKDKFVILKVLEGKRNLNIQELRKLELPSSDNKLIWHPR